MILGLTGPMASGKSTVVTTLKEMGFELVTLSDMVREECRARKIPEERENLMEVGQKLRAEHGAGILAVRALEKIGRNGGKKWVVDGIRNPAEVEALRKHPDFMLIANTASEDLIVSRILARKRADDTLNEAEIRRKLAREMGEGEPPDGQQVARCIALADHTFKNTMPFEEVPRAFKEFYAKITTTRNA